MSSEFFKGRPWIVSDSIHSGSAAATELVRFGGNAFVSAGMGLRGLRCSRSYSLPKTSIEDLTAGRGLHKVDRPYTARALRAFCLFEANPRVLGKHHDIQRARSGNDGEDRGQHVSELGRGRAEAGDHDLRRYPHVDQSHGIVRCGRCQSGLEASKVATPPALGVARVRVRQVT